MVELLTKRPTCFRIQSCQKSQVCPTIKTSLAWRDEFIRFQGYLYESKRNHNPIFYNDNYYVTHAPNPLPWKIACFKFARILKRVLEYWIYYILIYLLVSHICILFLKVTTSCKELWIPRQYNSRWCKTLQKIQKTVNTFVDWEKSIKVPFVSGM